MNNIRVIKTGIDVSKIIDQLNLYPDDWGSQKTLDNVKLQDPTKLHTVVDVLQLIMGGVEWEGQYVGDSEINYVTPAMSRHTEVVKFIKDNFHSARRCAFFKIPVGHKVERHIDFGTYYLDKDRYHLSISGRYKYTVHDGPHKEEIIIEPGTLFWFDNKKEHESENIADEPRIAFIFDVPMDPRNP